MFVRRGRGTSTLRDPRPDEEVRREPVAGAEESVRLRLDEFRSLFRDHGFRAATLNDPLSAAAVGASLSAPFISITDLIGHTREIVLDAIVELGTPEARAALLALAVAADGQLETLASRAAARMPGVAEPPWAKRARSPLTLVATDRLRDQDDERITGLVVAFKQGGYRACFVMRFYAESLLTERINYQTEALRSVVVSELAAGRGLAAPYRFTRRFNVTETRETMVKLVGALLTENERNLRRGTDRPPYPPGLVHLPKIGDVTVVPAVLVMLRKFVLSAYGIGAWKDVDRFPAVWS